MIRESFIEAAQHLERAKNYNPQVTTELINLCKKVSVNHSQKHLRSMFHKCAAIGFAIPDEEYQLHIDIVTSFSAALVELGKKHSRITRDFDGLVFDPGKADLRKYIQFSDPHLFAMALSLNLACRLEDLGLPGEAFNFLIKSFDPWVQKYDRDYKTGDIDAANIPLFDYFILGSIMMGAESNRRVLIGRSALHFRLLRILGDIENDSLTTYITTEKFVKKEKEAAYEDILFLTNYFELIALKQVKHKHYDVLFELLTAQYSYERQRNNQDFAFVIASSLARVTNSKEWVDEALLCKPSEPYWSNMFHIQAMSLFLDAPDDTWSTRLVDVVETFLRRATTIYDSRMLFELLKHKNSSFINYIIAGCIRIGQDQLAAELAYLWCMSKPDRLITHEVINHPFILSMPNLHPSGGHFIIYSAGKVIFTGTFSNHKLADIFKFKEKIEAAWFTILEEEETLERNLENRHQTEVSKPYIEALSDYIGIENVKELLADFPDNTHFHYLESSWTNTPIASILATQTNHTYTVLIDHAAAVPYNGIKKPLIWVNPDGSLSMSIREAEALEYLLKEHDIPYEIYKEEECTRSLFLEKYADPSFDLIWVSAHGKFNSDNPPFSELYIDTNGGTVTAWELQNTIPLRPEKRKLILNACESGTAGVRFNSMGFLGIAPAITNSYQTVLGHLWVVDSLGSSVYGIFLMEQLLQGHSLPYAAKAASQALLVGNIEIVNRLSAINRGLDIIDRVANTSKNFSLPFFSMSAVVFE